MSLMIFYWNACIFCVLDLSAVLQSWYCVIRLAQGKDCIGEIRF